MLSNSTTEKLDMVYTGVVVVFQIDRWIDIDR